MLYDTDGEIHKDGSVTMVDWQAPLSPQTWVDKKTYAAMIGVSVSTINRWLRLDIHIDKPRNFCGKQYWKVDEDDQQTTPQGLKD